MAPIILEGVTKVYPDGTTAVRDVDLTVHSGEFMVLGWALRLRQVHAAAHDRRARGDHKRSDPHR